jgi:ABC-type amino acid transport substrate-binding protein
MERLAKTFRPRPDVSANGLDAIIFLAVQLISAEGLGVLNARYFPPFSGKKTRVGGVIGFSVILLEALAGETSASASFPVYDAGNVHEISRRHP